MTHTFPIHWTKTLSGSPDQGLMPLPVLAYLDKESWLPDRVLTTRKPTEDSSPSNHTWSADGQHLLARADGGRLRLSGHTTMTCTLFALLLRLPRNGTLDFAGHDTLATSTETHQPLR